MSYRFDNDNLLAVYESESLGKFVLKLRFMEDNDSTWWEATLSCGNAAIKPTVAGASFIQFPVVNEFTNRNDALSMGESVFEIDPDALLIELHDGATRTSTHYGVVLGDVAHDILPMGPARIYNGDIGRYGITRLEVWDD